MTVDDPELAAIRAKKLERLLSAASAPNFTASNSYDFGQNDTDPSPVYATDEHGTSVAGVAAARGGNGIGVTGAAPFAREHDARFLRGVRHEGAPPEPDRSTFPPDPTPDTLQGMPQEIPTMLLFKDGKLVDGIVGAVPKAEIEALLDRWA